MFFRKINNLCLLNECALRYLICIYNISFYLLIPDVRLSLINNRFYVIEFMKMIISDFTKLSESNEY